jgi:multiple antibiotic resistance protein
MNTNIYDIVSVFMVLFAVIDITGSIPIIIDIKRRSGEIDSLKATLVSLSLMLAFLFLGEPILSLFKIDVGSFAIAGSFVIFILSLEMILGVEIFKFEASKSSSVVPIAFPLIAGAGTFTTIISLKSNYSMLTILIALLLNMIIVYFVLRATHFFEKILGMTGILIIRKIFGIILLAIAIKLFLSNTGIQLKNVQ